MRRAGTRNKWGRGGPVQEMDNPMFTLSHILRTRITYAGIVFMLLMQRATVSQRTQKIDLSRISLYIYNDMGRTYRVYTLNMKNLRAMLG